MSWGTDDPMPDAAAALVARLQQTLGRDVVHGAGEADFARHSRDLNNAMADGIGLHGVAYPRSTEQVSKILAACNEAGIAVVPQGGLTGLAGGGLATGPALIVSLERMRGIEELDRAGRTMTVLAGTVLETVQRAAEEMDLFFPLDLGGRGTAQIGGNAATNAGGNRVLRYGMMRELVLGVEVVLADGTILTSLNKMLKNNAGYDIKHLFLGSEGTLGIITRLVLRLFPKPTTAATALVFVEDFAGVIALLGAANAGLGGSLAAFEVMWPDFYRLGTTALGRPQPLPERDGLYVLLETLGSDPERDGERFEEVVGQMLDSGLIADAVLAASEAQRRDLWAIRECPGEFSRIRPSQIAFDVSLPIARMERFVADCRTALAARWPDIDIVCFGHLADSNIHLSVHCPRDPVPTHAIDDIVYTEVGRQGGSISAEHGIGTVKRDFLHHSRSPEELRLMRQLKALLDPNGVLNPGKVI